MGSLVGVIAACSLASAFVPHAAASALECQAIAPIVPCEGYEYGTDFIMAQDTSSTRPPCSNGTHTGPTIIELQLRLTHLSSVDVKRNRVTIQGYLRAWWEDPRLKFNSTAEGGCFDVISLTADQLPYIWMPDLYVDNVASGDDYTRMFRSSMARIEPNGAVWFSHQVLVTVDCKMSLWLLPYDKHTCGLRVASYSKGSDRVRLMPKDGLLSYGDSGIGTKGRDFRGSVWRPRNLLEGDEFTRAGRVEAIGGWDLATMLWDFERVPGYYERSYIVPAELFLALSYMQLFVDRHAAPARAALATIPILIMVTLNQMLYVSLPEGSQRMWISDLFICLLVLCVCSALELAAVQLCLVRERERAANFRDLQRVKSIAQRLIGMANDEDVSLLWLLDRYEAKQVSVPQSVFSSQKSQRHAGVAATPTSSTNVDLAIATSSQANEDHVAEPTGEEFISCWSRSEDALANNIREADLISILFVKQIFLKFHVGTGETQELHPVAFRNCLATFQMYVSYAHAAHIVCMFLRDSGKTTSSKCSGTEALQFSEFTELLLSIDDYVLDPDSVEEASWFKMRERMRTWPPSLRVDVIARWVFAFIIVAVNLGFFLAVV